MARFHVLIPMLCYGTMEREPRRVPFYKPAPTRPEIAKFIEIRLPNASRDEQIKATGELRELLAVVYRIYLRLESEGKLGEASEASRRKDEDRSAH